MIRIRIEKENKNGGKPRVRKAFSLGMILSLLLSGVLLTSGVTFAWLAVNRIVNQEGMKMTMDTTGNLVISASTSEIAKADIGTINGGSPFRLAASANSNKYFACTHDENYTNNLKYVQNASNVALSSGVATAGKTLTYAAAENAGGKYYYMDQVIYIASHGKALSSATLVAGIAGATKTVSDTPTAVTSGALMATSVDFYSGTGEGMTYLGTLNVAGLDRAANDYETAYSGTAKTSLYLVGSASSTGTIPLNTEGYLTFTLRLYFDGALQSGTNQTYINTLNVDLSKVTLNLQFEASGTEATAD